MWHQPCQRCNYTTSVDIQSRAIEKLVSRVKLHASAVSLLESGEQRCVKAINNIRCVRLCLFSALSPMVGALEIAIITITSVLAGK